MTLYDIVHPAKLSLKKFFCNHSYSFKIRPCGFQEFMISECRKCGYIRAKEI